MASYSIPSGGVAIIVSNTIFTSLAIVAVLARFYARRLTRRHVSIDDYLIVVGLVFTIATTGIGYALVLDGGAGLHTVDASEAQLSTILQLFVPAPLLWSFATTCVKLSILFFYISIFEWPGFRKAAYVIMAVTAALCVVVILESFLLCRPFAFTWDKTIQGVCGDAPQAYLSVAIVNLIVDLSIVALPMPVLWRLQMSWRKKLAISCILGLGLIVCAITAARIKAVVDLGSADFTYTVVPDAIYGGLEVQLGIVNACLPILKPVFKQGFGSDGVFSRIRSRFSVNDSKGGFERSNEYSHQSSTSFKDPAKRLRHMRDDVTPLYPITTASYADVDLEQQSQLFDPKAITVTQRLDVSRS